jgi:hypothetical protein
MTNQYTRPDFTKMRWLRSRYSATSLTTACVVSPVLQLLCTGALQELGEHEWAMYKPRWGAFYGTGLDSHLRLLQVDTLALTGCNFPNCPRTSIYEASLFSYGAEAGI